MKYEKITPQSPFASDEASGIKAVISGSSDFYGAHSLETFSSASGLSLTHEDAKGFLDFPTSFPGKAANFWKGDADVQVWAYEETYDNFQDTYGMDAVNVFYHSGHGNMDANGVYQAPLGSKWDGRDWVFSNNMAFSNEKLRYLFWSTCFSLRVSGPDNPVRTWWAPNKGGLRMLFGYETTSVDDANYGSYFWEEWKKGKSFARAFLDASWRISHNQVPVVMAVGANAAEANNRLNTEKMFALERVTKGYYAWQWIGTLPARALESSMAVSTDTSKIILSDKFANDELVLKIAREVGATRKDASTIFTDARGNRSFSSKEVQTHVSTQGALNLHFGKANLENTSLIDESQAVKLAQELINGLDLQKGVDLSLGNIRHKFVNGGTNKGSGTLGTPTVVETIVQFRQTHKGVKSINSDHGLIAIGVDNDGRITNFYDSTKAILGEAKKSAAKTAPPDPKGEAKVSANAQFARKLDNILAESHSKTTVIQEAIGYDFSANLGGVVHHKEVEIDLGNNLKKRYKVRVPIE